MEDLCWVWGITRARSHWYYRADGADLQYSRFLVLKVTWFNLFDLCDVMWLVMVDNLQWPRALAVLQSVAGAAL
jgi:hypothetical protein